MGHAIFISYRRDDSEGEAGRLFDDLTAAFEASNVFMDVAGISPGADFRKAIDDNVVSCGVLLAIIGPRWISITDAAGKRRLEDPDDFVALEIASALKRNVPVIPVLVHEATMPPADQLPEVLKDLAYRNSVELTHTRWNSDCQLLIEALKAYVKPVKSDAGDPVHATVAVQLPPPRPEPTADLIAAARPKKPLLVGAIYGGLLAVGAALLAIGFLVHLHFRPRPHSRSIAADSLRGRWVSPQHLPGGDLQMVEITGSRNRLYMQAWGACKPVPCSWGTQALMLDGEDGTATFVPVEPDGDASRRTAMVRVQPEADKLDVIIENTYNDHGTSHYFRAHRTFVASK